MSVKFDFKGLDKFEKELEEKAKAVSGKHSLAELFPDTYISSISEYTSLEELLKASPETITTAEEFQDADSDTLDKFISEKTPFPTWQAMLNNAAEKTLAEKLKF